MDDRIAQYGPFAMMASTILCVASTVKIYTQKADSTFHTSSASIENDVGHWPVEMADADQTVSRTDSIVTTVVLLASLLPIVTLSAFCLLHAAKQLRARARALPTWIVTLLRPVLLLLISCAAWKAVKPQNWFDHCALVLLLLLFAWNMMKNHIRLGHWRVWNIIVYVMPIILVPFQHMRHEVQGVVPAHERPTQPPSRLSEEHHIIKNQDLEVKRLLDLTAYHEEPLQLPRHTSTAEITRLKHELNRTKADANTTSSNAVADITRLTQRYDNLVNTTREALDPIGIYKDVVSTQYVVRRVKDQIASRKAELERREQALKGSSGMQAASAANEEAERSIASLKHDLENQATILTTLGAEAKRLQSALDTKDEELTQLSEAKGDADESVRIQRAGLQKTLDDTKAMLQKQIDDMETERQREAISKQELETALRENGFQLSSASSTSAELEGQVTALKKSEKKTRKDLDARTQEYYDHQEVCKASASALTKDLEAAESSAKDLQLKLTKAELENESICQLKQTIEALNRDLSAAASASTTQASEFAARRQRLVDEHNSVMAAREAEFRETLERVASEKEQMENAHVAAIAAKDLEIQTLKKQLTGSPAQKDSQQQPYFESMDIESATETGLQGDADLITALRTELAAEHTRAQGLEQIMQQLEQGGQQQRDALEAGRKAYESLQTELGVANQRVGEMMNTIGSGNQKMEEMSITLQCARRELDSVKDKLLDADTEVECQRDQVKMAYDEKTKAQEASVGQHRYLNDLQATIKMLREDLEKKDHASRIAATEHNASEYQAVYADLERAKDLLDEISYVGCDSTAQLVLEGLSIANGTFLKVTMTLKETGEGAQDDEAWTNIHEELSQAIIGEDLLSSLSVTNDTTESGHPTLLKQAQAANVRLRRLIKIVEEADANARKNHVLAVLVLPRGDEDTDDEGQGPESGSPGDADGATASKKRRYDDGVYSGPGRSSPSSTDKQTNQSSGSTSMKTASGVQPSTFTTASSFHIDPGHSFGFSFERPDVVEQRPPPEQRIFNLPTKNSHTPPQNAQSTASEDFKMENFDEPKLSSGKGMSSTGSSFVVDPVFSFSNEFPKAGPLAGLHGQNTPVRGLSHAEPKSPFGAPAQEQELGEINFEELDFQDELWNKATEDHQIDPQAGSDAVRDFVSPVTPSGSLDDAGEASLKASQAAEYLRTQDILRVQAEIDAEDSEAGTGLYALVGAEEDDGTYFDNILNEPQYGEDPFEDAEYHAMVDSAFGNHIPDDLKSEGDSKDGSVGWEDAMPSTLEGDIDFEWPEGLAPKPSEEEDSATILPVNKASQEQLNGRKIRTPKPTEYHPSQAPIDWSKISLAEAYMARRSSKMQSSGSGSADCPQNVQVGNGPQTSTSPSEPLSNADDVSRAPASQPLQSIDEILAALAATAPAGQSTQQQPQQHDYQGFEQAGPSPPAHPPQSRKRTRFED